MRAAAAEPHGPRHGAMTRSFGTYERDARVGALVFILPAVMTDSPIAAVYHLALAFFFLELTNAVLKSAGYAVVMAKDGARVPSTELFRTGGDSTVRGYGYRDIGIKLASGVIGPGRYLAVGSVEWQRPLRRNGLPTEFENTFFIDAGAVGDKPQDFRPSDGIGTGIRWRSPIGPLQIDLAYGVKARQLRLHTSVGFVF